MAGRLAGCGDFSSATVKLPAIVAAMQLCWSLFHRAATMRSNMGESQAMDISADRTTAEEPNHPQSVRMAVVSFLTFNVVIGSIFGTPGILLKPMAERLGASIEMVSVGPLAVILSSAIFAPIMGSLAVRFSMRSLLTAAALMLSAGWFLLAFTQSYVVYVGVYFVLMGPAMAIGASVLPPTLITRWFNRHRGLAIGLVHLPVLVAVLPLAAAWSIEHYGLIATFAALGAMPLAVLLPSALLIIDRPPGQAELVEAMIATGTSPALSVGQLLAQPAYWGLCLAVGITNTSSTMLGVHLVSMGESWGLDRLSAAGLASIMAGCGLFGSILFGILADRIGGGRSLALIAAADAVLWGLLFLGLPYAGLAAVIGMIGLLGSGTVPSLAKAAADRFGRESISRAMGLMVPVTLPLLVAGMIGPGAAVRLTGSYTVVISTFVIGFALATLAALAASGRRSEVSHA
ncbi:MAG: MFS transporter [Novosphingobium sp.]